MKAFGRGLVFFILRVLFIPAVFLVASTGFAQTSKTITVQPAPVYKGKRLYSNSWAVVIGVNRYQHPRIPTLRYARKDAEDLRAIRGAISPHFSPPTRRMDYRV